APERPQRVPRASWQGRDGLALDGETSPVPNIERGEPLDIARVRVDRLADAPRDPLVEVIREGLAGIGAEQVAGEDGHPPRPALGRRGREADPHVEGGGHRPLTDAAHLE